MNAPPHCSPDSRSLLHFARMEESDLDGVVAIEVDVFPFPWSRKVFQGSIAEGYDCWVARDEMNRLIGYFVLMKVVDEVHLLTIAVHRSLHGRGVGRKLLDQAISLAREMKMESMLLEVRLSNARALTLYKNYGFARIGMRKNYYVALGNTREDALVMRLAL